MLHVQQLLFQRKVNVVNKGILGIESIIVLGCSMLPAPHFSISRVKIRPGREMLLTKLEVQTLSISKVGDEHAVHCMVRELKRPSHDMSRSTLIYDHPGTFLPSMISPYLAPAAAFDGLHSTKLVLQTLLVQQVLQILRQPV